jgi:hypothetical protein
MSPAIAQDSLSYYFTADSVSTRPSGWEISLHTGNPGDAGLANEVADSAYARRPATFRIEAADAAAPQAENAETIAFASAVDGYTVTHVVIWETANGRPLAIQRLITEKAIPAGSPAQFLPGELIVGGRN